MAKPARLFHMSLMSAALLASLAGAASAQSATDKAVLAACKGDIATFCGNVQPGGGRIKACMKSHAEQVSAPCKEQLYKAWLKKQ